MTEHSGKEQLKGEKVNLSSQFQVLCGIKVKAVELQTASHIHRGERGASTCMLTTAQLAFFLLHTPDPEPQK